MALVSAMLDARCHEQASTSRASERWGNDTSKKRRKRGRQHNWRPRNPRRPHEFSKGCTSRSFLRKGAAVSRQPGSRLTGVGDDTRAKLAGCA